ncbi:MAG TPA: 50S ribosomal protein L23 [Rhabdochlamydiaceae bacterium]|nr:50S ribosomal protein L23 [Rhabdochlamydiaceae bacterium]
MLKKSPYDIVFSRYVTEKARVLSQLQFNNSNACVQKCTAPKYVFLVDKRANKQEIAEAVEVIYAMKNIKVVSVNVINMKPKAKSMRGRPGLKAGFKKAIVTLESGDTIEEQV